MNWFKDNPFLSGLIACAVIGVGVLSYLAFEAASAYELSASSHSDAVNRLRSLQSKSPYPSQQNVAALEQQVQSYAASIQALHEDLARMEAPLNTSITPQGFQDDLRRAVNSVRDKASVNGVNLPENFYLGFQQYENQVPSPEAAPYLNRQLLVIAEIVNQLIDYRVVSVDSIQRKPLPQESGAPAPTNNRAKPTDAAPAPEVLTRYPFDVSFTGDPAQLRLTLNELVKGNEFVIVRALQVASTMQSAPEKNDPNDRAPGRASEASTGSGSADSSPNKLRVLLGQEKIKADLRLEMIDFTEPQAAK